jgi:hypothetical protein
VSPGGDTAEAIDRVYGSEPEADVYLPRRLPDGGLSISRSAPPAAERFRRLAGRIGAEKDLFWAEYQAKLST